MAKKRKNNSKIKYRVYIAEKEKDGIRYIAAYMKTGNYTIEQIYSIDQEEKKLGIIRKGWQIAQGLCESYPDKKVAIVASLESFTGGTVLEDIYELYQQELNDCLIKWDYPIYLEFIQAGDNPAMKLIDLKASGYMNYSVKMQ